MIVSTGELATLFGVDERSIQLLAKEGIAVRLRSGKYDAAKSVQNRIDQAAQGGPARAAKTKLDQEKTRLAKEQADAHRLKNQILRGDLLPRADVERQWIRVMQHVRNGVLACPSRLRSKLPHLTAADAETITRELREALTVLAGDEVGHTECA